MKKQLICCILCLLSLPAMAGWARLSWSASAEADGYRVYWSTTSHHYNHTNDVGAETTATITGLVNTVTYYFAVTAYNVAGESDFSSEISATIPPLPTPGDVSISGGTLTWSEDEADALQGFFIYQKEIGVKRFTQTRVAAGVRSYQPPGLLPGSTYQFWVKAFTSLGSRIIVSSASDTVSYTEPLRGYSGDPALLPPDMLESGAARILFFGAPGATVQVEGLSEAGGTWVTLGQMTEVVSGHYEFVDSSATLFTQRFYRVK